MPRLKEILQEVTISSKAGADYSNIQSALSDGIKTLRIEDQLTLSASIVFPSGITLIIGTSASIIGSYTLTGNDTILILEGDNYVLATTVQFAGTWISREVRPEWFGAIGDGAVNDYPAFSSAIALCKLTRSKTLVLRNKTYLVDGEIHPEGISIHGNNALLMHNLGSLIKATGTHSSYVSLTGNAYKGDNWIKCNNAGFLATLNKGDLVKILSDEIAQPAAMENVRFGEMHEIRSVDTVNGIIYFNDYMNWYYMLSDSARVCKVSPVDVIIRDLKVWLTGESTTMVGMNFQYARPWIENVRIKAYTYGCMFDNCWRPFFRGQTFQSDQDGYGYGVCVSSATMYADISGIFIGARHCFTTGGSGASFGTTYGGISWHTNVHDSIGAAGTLTSGMFDTHASSGSITFNNVVALGGVFRDYALTISDWNSGITYPIDSRVRSATKRLYRALVETTNNNPDVSPTQWKADPGNNQSGFKAEGLYETYINCRTIGCNNGLQVYGVDVQEIIVKDMDMTEVSFGLLQRYDCKVQKFHVDGIRITNEHIQDGIALFLAGNTVDWSFMNFKLKGARIAQKTLNTIKPNRLVISNAEASMPSAYNGPAIAVYDQDVNVVCLRNIDVKNMNLYATINDNGRVPTKLLEISNVSVEGNPANAVYLDHPVENVMINGLNVKDNGDSATYLIYIRRAVTRLSLINSSYIGANALRAIYTYSAATLGYLLHNNNSMPDVTVFRTGTGALAAIEILGGGIGAMVVLRGSGTPEGVVTASVGTMYLRSNGGASTTLYIKESGTGNTGWIPK